MLKIIKSLNKTIIIKPKSIIVFFDLILEKINSLKKKFSLVQIFEKLIIKSK